MLYNFTKHFSPTLSFSLYLAPNERHSSTVLIFFESIHKHLNESKSLGCVCVCFLLCGFLFSYFSKAKNSEEKTQNEENIVLVNIILVKIPSGLEFAAIFCMKKLCLQ